MVIAGKEDFGNDLSNFGKNFCGLRSWQISTAHYCARGRMTRLFTTTLIMMNYYPITATYLSTYILPAAPTNMYM